MSATDTNILTSEDLRPRLHHEIDRLSDTDIAILHRVALQLELEHLSEKLDEAFDQDRAEGKLDRIPELIRSARNSLRVNSA